MQLYMDPPGISGLDLSFEVGLELKGERELCINGHQHVTKMTVKALPAAFRNTLRTIPEQSFYLNYLVFMTMGIHNLN